MPRSLSGLKTGDFDTLEVSGDFQHTGSTPAGFSGLACTGLVQFSGDGALEEKVTFTTSEGSLVYDGSASVSVTIPPLPADDKTLTVTQGSANLGTYNPTSSSADVTIAVPPFPVPEVLTLKYDPGPGSTTYDTAVARTVYIPVPQTVCLQHSAEQGVPVLETEALLFSTFGLTFTPPVTQKYLIEVQLTLQNNSTTDAEQVTLSLPSSLTSVASPLATDIIFVEKSTTQLVQYKTVITLVGGSAVNIGLALKSETEVATTDLAKVLFGGPYPDIVMAATPVQGSFVAYVVPAESDGDDY